MPVAQHKAWKACRKGRVRTSSMGSCLFKPLNKVEPKRLVRVEQGMVEGTALVTSQGSQCEVYLGIPYAKPPVGELRFQKPQPPDSWDDVLKCKKFPSRSVQKDMMWDKVMSSASQSEDCLYLNVFAPAVEEGNNKKHPVLFYIHGGGWLMDSAEKYTPKNVCRLLVSKGIVVVTIHYRLGYLGFMSTGDSVCKGNFGLWDMLEALKWTHANIEAFGGDPKNITLSGQSAGAASADLLSISPLARGLFNKKILMGGNSYCHWATTKPAEIREYCRRKAIKLGYKPRDSYSSTTEESADIFDFFKRQPAEKLETTMFFSKTIFTKCKLPLAPVIDGEILPESLSQLRANAPQVPSIVGGGEYESLLFIAIGLLRCSAKDVAHAIDEVSTRSGYAKSFVQKCAQQLYGDSQDVRNNAKKRKRMYVEMISDIFFNYANYRLMDEQKKAGNNNCYAFCFEHTSKNVWGWLQHVVPFTGGTHTSDVTYLFDCNYMNAPLPMDKQDRVVSDVMTRYFAQFVKSGNPNEKSTNGAELPQWTPIQNDDTEMKTLCFNLEPQMKTKEYIQRMRQLQEERSKIPSIQIS
ncbi:unnamed protein product [Caenorhabditis auriculariae]|uniref:Carboxylic ester hydrolase n=1 Tax=Caenorhabditis auriculariae TaxID=2777116 RepID=A0A8S1HG81_9PELO|nr:unnamed protein product [Caenorhabditis auriculariae]